MAWRPTRPPRSTFPPPDVPGAKAELNGGFSGTFNYDFANASFDAAYITWKQSDALAIDVGFRKVPFVYDEFTSSSDIRAIERSPVTRYFVESNNGRRLGAGSYRTGVYLGGTQNGVFYNVAVTNPERDEFSSLTGNSDPGVQGAGTKATTISPTGATSATVASSTAAATRSAPRPACCPIRGARPSAPATT